MSIFRFFYVKRAFLLKYMLYLLFKNEAMTEQLEHNDWKGTTGGMPWMQRSLVSILGHTDPRIVYFFVALVAPFYMLFSHQGYIAQYRFFTERLQEPWWKAFWHVYVNHFRFGQIIIDRFAAYGGRNFKFEIANQDIWQHLSSQPEGFIQMSSHIGNYELAGYSLRSAHKRLYALVFMGETETVMKNRSKEFTPNNIEMVPIMPDMSHIFTLNNALANGNIASMPSDRIFGSQKALNCRFFGLDAKFPLGPFSLAVSRGCGALAVFVMKKKWDTYSIYIFDLSKGYEQIDSALLSKKNVRQQALADEFARRLEEMVRKYPTQWFNYYDFWK